jgi:hypothetical protein
MCTSVEDMPASSHLNSSAGLEVPDVSEALVFFPLLAIDLAKLLTFLYGNSNQRWGRMIVLS